MRPVTILFVQTTTGRRRVIRAERDLERMEGRRGGDGYHDFSSLLFFQDEAERVPVRSRHQTKKQRLLAIRQLTHIHWMTHTHTHLVFMRLRQKEQSNLSN